MLELLLIIYIFLPLSMLSDMIREGWRLRCDRKKSMRFSRPEGFFLIDYSRSMKGEKQRMERLFMWIQTRMIHWIWIIWMTGSLASAVELNAVVVAEEEVCSIQPADNGAGPMWCRGNTCIVRDHGRVVAGCIETIPDAKPLNNCLPVLYERTPEGWKQVYKGKGRTREPSPLGLFLGQSVLMSINPTLTEPDVYSGPSEPKILKFDPSALTNDPVEIKPVWKGAPEFSEHSYRSFAVDGMNREMILIQNIGYNHAEWSFCDRDGVWSSQGELVWPYEEKYDKPQHVRICYPAVALHDRAVYFLGVSDIVEPYDKFREYKFKLTGRQWDYDFRRLFYTWSDDITTGVFHEWVELASRDHTCGWITPCDLSVSSNREIFILWTERAIDERLREEFFPNEKQRHTLQYGIVKEGTLTKSKVLVEWNEDTGGETPGGARFHRTEDNRLLVIYFVSGTAADGKPVSENRLVEIYPDGDHGEPVALNLRQPLSNFFTATQRAGCGPSHIIDLYGQVGNGMRYCQIKVN